jgi:hypothetical protein
MNDECKMMNDECRARRRSAFNHHSSIIIHHSPRGISLMEVLISIGILSVGLLGIAAMIPIGKVAISATNRSDRTGACGRAGLRDVKVRRMLDPNTWLPIAPMTNPFVIDPLGLTATPPLSPNLGPLHRVNFNWGTPVMAQQVFVWHDDLTFTLPEDIKSGVIPPAGTRPVAVTDALGNRQFDGKFSWFLTIARQIIGGVATTTSTVSVVVCQGNKRLLTGGEEVTPLGSMSILSGPIGYGGVAVQVNGNWPTTRPLKDNDWILLTSLDSSGAPIYQASWYRVVSAGFDGTKTNLMLVGPDWHGGDATSLPARTFTAVSVDGVTGVYTSTVQLDQQ